MIKKAEIKLEFSAFGEIYNTEVSKHENGIGCVVKFLKKELYIPDENVEEFVESLLFVSKKG